MEMVTGVVTRIQHYNIQQNTVLGHRDTAWTASEHYRQNTRAQVSLACSCIVLDEVLNTVDCFTR